MKVVETRKKKSKPIICSSDPADTENTRFVQTRFKIVSTFFVVILFSNEHYMNTYHIGINVRIVMTKECLFGQSGPLYRDS